MKRQIRIIGLLLAVLICVSGRGYAYAADVEPQGNLASIYQSETPFYGSTTSYPKLMSTNSYSVEFAEAVGNILETVFIAGISAVCPELGVFVSSAWSTDDMLVDLHTIFCSNSETASLKGFYVSIQCYEPTTQPTPDTVVYSKYVVQEYYDRALRNPVAGTRQVYYQKLKYNLFSSIGDVMN